MVNDLERPVFEKYSLLPTLKNWLLDQGECRAALMSGSGSTVYAITENSLASGALMRKAKELCGDTTWVQIAQTLQVGAPS
jgi:4-diphosphocytidyl-2-C-methyl-D-erythritol kinase